jgi:putative phosphoesterase
VRVALLSDVHANLQALLAIEGVLRQADRVVCLGDVVGYYCQVNEVLDFIRSLDPVCVLGNHDWFLLHGCPATAPEAVQFGIRYADRAITADHRAWLAAQPLCWGGTIGGRSFLLNHGSPWDPLHGYLYADNSDLALLHAFRYDVVAFGQTHRVLQRTEAMPLLLNPGSVGQSRDVTAAACTMVVDTRDLSVEPVARPYDPGPVMSLAKHEGAGDWVSRHLI